MNVATVLQEAADSASALTVVRCGIFTTISETGEVRDFVSSGFTGEEHRRFREWPDGRGVLMLVNGTPIRDEDGRVVSVVVAMQDLAPCQLLERQRAVTSETPWIGYRPCREVLTRASMTGWPGVGVPEERSIMEDRCQAGHPASALRSPKNHPTHTQRIQ